MVGFLLPFSSPLMYCWLKPEVSASFSGVKPASSLILRVFRLTQLAHTPARRSADQGLVIDLPEPSAAGGLMTLVARAKHSTSYRSRERRTCAGGQALRQPWPWWPLFLRAAISCSSSWRWRAIERISASEGA